MCEQSPDVVRGRLAPSPTGALHLGNARSFLIAWLSIRSRKGALLLRMEDLDHPKVKAHAAEQALDDLRWLGLDWDEGPDIGGPCAPYVQSARTERYAAALARLQAAGRVYPCVCSRKDVEAGQSAPHASEEGLAYDGACRGRFATYAEAAATLPAGRLPAWRFAVTPVETAVGRLRGRRKAVSAGAYAGADRDSSPGSEFLDGFHGPQREDVAATVGDFVIARHPLGAGYMLAVVVDDAAMGVTEVLRGDDLLPATHRQLQLYRALGLKPPHFIHVPLVVATDGRRLAKRHGDTRIAALRQAGLRPSQVIGRLAAWCGWAAPDEELMPVDLLPRFCLDAIPRAPVVLTEEIKRAMRVPA
ncbi:MAG: tRNA glutamyl-Q(34) synthetase GluQRS [Kiritimatiellia bacterium]